MSVHFKAGKYYVGDLCYVINDENWQELIEKTNCFQEEVFRFKGKDVFVSSTAHGDGVFYDQENREYGVDAGLIGVIPFDVIDDNHEGNGGQIIEFDKDFIAYEEDGIFHIENIVIDTDDMKSDEDDDWDEEETEECDDEEIESDNSLPICKLSGTDGNVFAIIGRVRDTLMKAGLKDQAEEFSSKAMKQHSYQDVLVLCCEYVDVY